MGLVGSDVGEEVSIQVNTGEVVELAAANRSMLWGIMLVGCGGAGTVTTTVIVLVLVTISLIMNVIVT